MSFVHLHVHTQYSILDGAAAIPKLLEKAFEDGQPALAITDHGNMFGVKDFLVRTKAFNKGIKEKREKEENTEPWTPIKPIVGCEFYVAKDDRWTKRGKDDERSTFHLILLAKNMVGYHNLIKLSSLAYIEGFYRKPRIDRELLAKYHEGLICSSACLAGEVPTALYVGDIDRAEETILWYKELFGEDYYLEVQLHKTELPGGDLTVYQHQQIVNKEIFNLAKKFGIKVIATNDVHFVRKEDGPGHDRLICLNTGAYYTDEKRLRYTQQEYLKTQQEMSELFPEHPEVIENTLEVANKVEEYDIDSKPILPIFPIPEEFENSEAYLRYLTLEGAKKRYGEQIPQNIQDRIDFELSTIQRMGFPDYFLIVRDFIIAVREKGVSVGPGRGSAAGSVVAYCLTITDIDPIKYDLLFERFLNPDRISMPDIDIDFDDEGRSVAFQYVEEKYGKDHVSHVATFGTMAVKSAIKDVARVERLPLEESIRLTKLIPDTYVVKVEDKENKGQMKDERKKATMALCLANIPEFSAALNSDNEILSNTFKYAAQLEGSIRQTGVHACALIIGRSDLTDYIPICTVEDKEAKERIMVSQYEGSFIESVGMLKMDFLGLATLSIIKECLNLIERTTGKKLDIDHIPVDDAKTFDLFGRGDTIGIFQFESDGMRGHLRNLKPERFEDLIAMNALYRPGPMQYIPDFISRKHRTQKIEYDLPEMEEILKDTYGITVYQEQVMLLSQKLAGFTPGQADTLRKAMGKKKRDLMAQLKIQFVEGGEQKGHSKSILEKIWADWLNFAEYAFNKSHSTCYAWLGYQTAYLKAHYPSEFLAANLSKNLNDIVEITKLMSDCKRMGIKVLGPDVNESFATFSVNKMGNVRFGMAGIKGVGPNVVMEIVKTREAGGPFKNIFDFIERVPAQVANRKVIESLSQSGGFDSFKEISRAQFYLPSGKEETFTDALLIYGGKFHNDSLSAATSLFGGATELAPVRPDIPPIVGEVNDLELLKREKELVGMYISAHPLDKYRFEMDTFTTNTLAELNTIDDNLQKDKNLQNKEFYIAGIVSKLERKKTKTNQDWCTFTIEDFSGTYDFRLFSKDYEKYIGYVLEHNVLFIKCYSQLNFSSKKKEEEKPETYSLKVKNMMLLSNVKGEFIKNVRVSVELDKITPDFRKSFVKGLKSFKGDTLLYLRVHFLNDGEDDAVEFVSSNYRVTPSYELFAWLTNMGLSYGLSTKISL